jgi:hypothetical protein
MPFTITAIAQAGVDLEIDYDTAEHWDRNNDEMTERRQLRDEAAF